MKKTILLSIATLVLAGSSQARTWTSADGSKTFEGDLVSCDDTSVTVKRGTKELTFKLEILSEDDQKWAKAETLKAAAAEGNKKAAAEFAESDFGKAFRKLQKFDGKKFSKFELEEAPKHFLIYFGASW